MAGLTLSETVCRPATDFVRMKYLVPFRTNEPAIFLIFLTMTIGARSDLPQRGIASGKAEARARPGEHAGGAQETECNCKSVEEGFSEAHTIKSFTVYIIAPIIAP